MKTLQYDTLKMTFGGKEFDLPVERLEYRFMPKPRPPELKFMVSIAHPPLAIPIGFLVTEADPWSGRAYGGDGYPVSPHVMDRVRRAAERVELRLHRGPIKELGLVVVSNVNAVFVVYVQVPNRDREDELVTVRLNHGPFSIDRPELGIWLAQKAVEACMEALRHELEEGMMVEGLRVFDPHRGELQGFRPMDQIDYR